MKEYKRLTARVENKVIFAGDLLNTPNYEKAIIDRLAELEDKIESGKLVEMPCEVGDTVYCLIATGPYGTLLTTGKVFERKVSRIIWDGKRWEIHSERRDYYGYNDGDCNFYGYLDQESFTTKEAAEAKLAELRGEK